MTSWASPSRRSPLTRRISANRSPYNAFRAPSMIAVAAPASGAPPPAITAISPNWLAPVNISRDNAMVCQTLSPPASAMAPNEMAYAPVAMATPIESRSTWVRVSRQSRSGGSRVALPWLVLPWLVLPWLVLPWLVLSGFVLSGLVLSGLVLPWLVASPVPSGPVVMACSPRRCARPPAAARRAGTSGRQVGQQTGGAATAQPHPSAAVREPQHPGQFPAGELGADGQHGRGGSAGHRRIDP